MARSPADMDENVAGSWAAWKGETPASSDIVARSPVDMDENVAGSWAAWKGETPASSD